MTMQNRKPTDKTSSATPIKSSVVRNLGKVPDQGTLKTGPHGTSLSHAAAYPAETEYDRDMRILEEIGKTDHTIFAALAK